MEPMFFFCRLVPPRPDFAMTLTDDERAMMAAHSAYLRTHLEAGRLIVAGPVADPAGPWGLAVWRVSSEAELAELTANDPAILANRGIRYESMRLLSALAK